jgi:hypothetical protein
LIKSVSSFFAVFELFVNSFKNGSKNAILVGYHLGDRQSTMLSKSRQKQGAKTPEKRC